MSYEDEYWTAYCEAQECDENYEATKWKNFLAEIKNDLKPFEDIRPGFYEHYYNNKKLDKSILSNELFEVLLKAGNLGYKLYSGGDSAKAGLSLAKSVAKLFGSNSEKDKQKTELKYILDNILKKIEMMRQKLDKDSIKYEDRLKYLDTQFVKLSSLKNNLEKII